MFLFFGFSFELTGSITAVSSLNKLNKIFHVCLFSHLYKNHNFVFYFKFSFTVRRRENPALSESETAFKLI